MIIFNGTVHPMDGPVISRGYVAFEDGKITAVGSMEELHGPVEGLDAEGGHILPGFVDAHTHQGGFDMIDQNGMDLNEMTDPVTPQVCAIDGCNPLDKNFRSVPAAGEPGAHLPFQLQRGVRPGLRGPAGNPVGRGRGRRLAENSGQHGVHRPVGGPESGAG